MSKHDTNLSGSATATATAMAGAGRRGFNALSHWLANIPWWKFLIFALIWMVCGALLQEMLFGSDSEQHAAQHPTRNTVNINDDEMRDFSNGKLHIHIDKGGIHIEPVHPSDRGPDEPEDADEPASAEDAAASGTGAHPAPHAAATNSASAHASAGADEPDPAHGATRDATHEAAQAARTAAATDAARHKLDAAIERSARRDAKLMAKAAQGDAASASAAEQARAALDQQRKLLKYQLPPEIGEQLTEAIDEAVNDEAARRTESYRRKSGEWFPAFFMLIIMTLIGIKVLVGGKARAEAQAMAARASAERETLRRQVSEARMQMMQAQVEPHFLFNTLASVEYLIETDPPRAGAMQRSLIAYLRAVLPQMREITPVTNLGREVTIVKAYLDILKMRMEDRLQVDIDVPDDISFAEFPPMMLQSLAENAIKHGLEPKDDGGTLSISARAVDGILHVTVKDDGLGFGAVPSKGTGLGLQSIRERLKLLHGDKAHLTISPNQPSGVIAEVTLPFQTANQKK